MDGILQGRVIGTVCNHIIFFELRQLQYFYINVLAKHFAILSPVLRLQAHSSVLEDLTKGGGED